MKFRNLITIVAFFVIAVTANATEIYNKRGNTLDLYSQFNCINYLSNDSMKNGDFSSFLFGIAGKTKINNQITGFSTWECNIDLPNYNNIGSQHNHTRLGFVGLKFGDYGSLNYGRNYGILYDVGSLTNVMPAFGGDTSIADNYLSSCANNLITYRNNNFFGIIHGLDFAFQCQRKSHNDKEHTLINTNIKKENGYGHGVSISYNVGHGITTSAAYANSNRTISQKRLDIDNKEKRAKAYSLGMKYDVNSLYLAAIFSETSHMTPFGDFSRNYVCDNNIYGFLENVKNIELVAQYNFDSGFRPSIGYLVSKCRDSNKNIQRFDNQYLVRYIELGASYNLNDNMSTFLDYRLNLLKKDEFSYLANISCNNIISMGLIYTF